MNLPLFAQTNSKGQVVIPKAIREKLGIRAGTLLEVVVRAQGLYLYPVNTVARDTDSRTAFIKLLKKTAGSWGPATPKEQRKEAAQHKLEVRASKKRKSAW
ncbi:MAG: hypothetical protein COU69_03610 [Candidatus Pacebacteria bacterium CG10_big_fil_rev_8_21_14_0_10_56_10]|nr:MAG: hypothetical protein COU69_03610 [Candidatus Pacebacteria bacterium CG10_big_fil_rev_8_21_14_0_10_56_10]